MKRTTLILLFLFSSLWTTDCRAYYVLAFEYRPEDANLPEKLTVIALLGDHFANYFGMDDSFRGLLAENLHANPKRFAEGYLEALYEWYIGQILAHPEMYGDTGPLLVDSLRTDEPISDGYSSVLAFTQYHELMDLVGLLRMSGEDQDGLLAGERHMAKQGFPLKLEGTGDAFANRESPDFSSVCFQYNVFDIGVPFSRRWRRWLGGARAEMKTWALDQQYSIALFPHQYTAARTLKLFSRGSRTWPATYQYEPGDPEPHPATQSGYGMDITRLFAQAYAPQMAKWDRRMGMEHALTVKNKATHGAPVDWLQASPDQMDKAVERLIAKFFPEFATKPHRLVYDRAFTRMLREVASCSRMLDSGVSLKKTKARSKKPARTRKS